MTPDRRTGRGSPGSDALTPANNLRLIANYLRWLLTGYPKIDLELREMAERLSELAEKAEADCPPRNDGNA